MLLGVPQGSDNAYWCLSRAGKSLSLWFLWTGRRCSQEKKVLYFSDIWDMDFLSTGKALGGSVKIQTLAQLLSLKGILSTSGCQSNLLSPSLFYFYFWTWSGSERTSVWQGEGSTFDTTLFATQKWPALPASSRVPTSPDSTRITGVPANQRKSKSADKEWRRRKGLKLNLSQLLFRNCTWKIKAPMGNKVNLTFSHFEMEQVLSVHPWDCVKWLLTRSEMIHPEWLCALALRDGKLQLRLPLCQPAG